MSSSQEAPLGDELTAALELAAANVATVARAQIGEAPITVDLPQGQRIVVGEEPVRSAAIYVPGGRAPYPSTVIMGAVTAREAGVERVVVCSPGPMDAAIRGTCALCGVDELYAMGGAQAIAALAYGTGNVEPVDVIVGPGNAYVTEAKRQVFGDVGIDGLAGPSELVVVLEDAAAVPLVALDLGAQAEHGEGSLVVAISSSAAVLDALATTVAPAGDVPCVLVEADDPLALADALAPEHLQLVGVDGAEGRIAGCIFIGARSATAFGDYVAGSNHVLPTGGAARFSSALSPRVFRRRVSMVQVGDGVEPLARAGAAIARAEGIDRTTKETQIRLSLSLDGNGAGERTSGVGFLDHMLDLLARHGRMDLDVAATGDLETGGHHTVEDVGICLGQALDRALGDRRGIVRYGHSLVPMDEALATCAIDVSGRPFCACDAPLPAGAIGNFDHELAEEFFRAVANTAKLTLHLRVEAGSNAHHMIEAAFKAFARSLRAAVAIDPGETGVPSTKGTLT